MVNANSNPIIRVAQFCVVSKWLNTSLNGFCHTICSSVRCLGALFPRSFVTQPSPSASSDNHWKLIFSTIILIYCVWF